MRGEATMLSASMLLAATLALGIVLVASVSAYTALHSDIPSCVPQVTCLNSSIVIVNVCDTPFDAKFYPYGGYRVVTGDGSFYAGNVTLQPGDVVIVYGAKGVAFNNTIVVNACS